MFAQSLAPVLNHLWQSTMFGAAIGGLVLLLRKVQARFRYALWLAASVKFLVPFALFIAVGSRMRSPRALPLAHTQWSAAVTQASRTLSEPITYLAAPMAGSHAAESYWIVALLAIWAVGFAVVIGLWLMRWHRLRAMVRAARPLAITLPIPVLSSSSLVEPSLFGIFKPVLLLPEGIERRLSKAQLEAVYAHELCHVRRRDNLAAALHMLVEALFWFHPLVWWLEGRLIEERERACDEAVLQAGNPPQDYAESILEVCKLCLASPLACTSGVTGADLKKRIETIMSCRIGRRLDTSRKVLLAAVGALAVALPVAMGVLDPAQAQQHPSQTFEVVSIKPSDPATYGHTSMTNNSRSGRFTTEGITAKNLIDNAYGNVYLSQIEGLPNWTDSERYDISAKGESFADIDPYEMSDEEIKAFHHLQQARLQALLVERFQLKVHRITKELPVYGLVVAKNGPKLQPTKEAIGSRNRGMHIRDGRMTATDLPMDSLVSVLSGQTSRVVIDRTGLTGHYDFTLNWTPEQRSVPLPDDHPPAGESGPSIFTAVQEQLGLKLVSEKGPVEILVVDHIEKPSPN